MARLQKMGFIRREIPDGQSEKCKRALYKPADPFIAAWFKYIAGHRSLLVGASSPVRHQIWHAGCNALFASAWEELARKAVRGLGEAGKIPRHTIWHSAGRFWHGNAAEWDVVSESLNKEYLLLGGGEME